ncbi:unnamed protein product [Meganyctiphanes norvegica]|uniref:Glycosyltransferase 2-like domain-containing protein n=1 Tax=Meganyctiphanes norvegica TaxID=48144 RepID=A0AAV2RUG4_MEGNR
MENSLIEERLLKTPSNKLNINNEHIDVAIIIPVHNAGYFLDECFQSIEYQEHNLQVEVSIYLDCCTDNSEEISRMWMSKLQSIGYKVLLTHSGGNEAKGCGYAKNYAIKQSSGEFLCFLDADDVMMPFRIQKQWNLAKNYEDAIVGSCFYRDPPDSTIRYAKWANTLNSYQLYTQIYTSNGPTVIMPTWFCHRSVVEKVGYFDESGHGTTEDLIFFYKHLRYGGKILRQDAELLMYRYHPNATTFSVNEETIWNLRLKEIQENIIMNWSQFTIWNGGKQGRKFYRSLTLENQRKVVAFCDVDVKKVGKFYTYEHSAEKNKPKVPIIHFSEAKPPLVICMKLDLTGGGFEKNLESLMLKEGRDYYHFN